MLLFFHQSFVRLRAPVVTDQYRNRVRDWAAAERLPVTGVSIQPASRSEEHAAGNRDTATAGWTVRTPPGMNVDLLATDRVELDDGTVCEVVGEVARHPDPFGRGLHHVEASVQRVTG